MIEPKPPVVKPRRGRPRKFENPSHLTLWIESTMHDRLILEAKSKGKDVGEYARELLDAALNRRTH